VTVAAIGLTQSAEVTAHSDERGIACIEELQEGLYAIEASMPGFLTVRYYPVRPAPERVTTLRYMMQLGDIRTERLTDGDALVVGTLKSSGQPVARARICLKQPEGNAEPRCSDTSQIGEYLIAVPPGAYVVEITAMGSTSTSPLLLRGNGIYRNRLELSGR
jgi:hypothetical protein